MKKEISPGQVVKNYLKLAVIIGILPWSYYYIRHLAPIINHALGIDQMRFVQAGVYLIPIILPPLLLYSWLSKDDEDEHE